MEVRNVRCTFLTNHEVLTMLESTKASSSNSANLHQHNTIIYESLKYLRSTPIAGQTDDSIATLVRALNTYDLTPAELLQIVNLRPKSVTDITMIIEEVEERYTDEQVEQILAHIAALPVAS